MMAKLVFVIEGAGAMTGAVAAAMRIQKIAPPELCVRIMRPGRSGVNSDEIDFQPALLRKTIGSLLSYPARLFQSSKALMAHLSDDDIVVANDFFYMEPAIIRLLGFRGRTVTWVRIDPRRFGIVGRLWLGAVRFASDNVVAVSDFIASTLPSQMRAVRIYDSVAIPDSASVAEGQRLLFIGNYIDGKGQDDAIHAFHRIADAFPEATLKFVGGDLGLEANRLYRRKLEIDAANGPGKGRISFHDFVDDTRPELESCLAAVNLSHSESFSLTCLEAAAGGRAVIATRCGGPEEIVRHERTGLLVDVGDIDGAATAMRRLLGNPALAARMGLDGQADARERFGQDKFIRQVKRVLLTDAPNA